MDNSKVPKKKWPIILLAITSVIFVWHLLAGNSKPERAPDLDAKMKAAMSLTLKESASNKPELPIEKIQYTLPASNSKSIYDNEMSFSEKTVSTATNFQEPMNSIALNVEKNAMPSETNLTALGNTQGVVPLFLDVKAPSNLNNLISEWAPEKKDKISSKLRDKISSGIFYYFRYQHFLLSFTISDTSVKRPGRFPEIIAEKNIVNAKSCNSCILISEKMILYLSSLDQGIHAFADSKWSLQSKYKNGCDKSDAVNFLITDDESEKCRVGNLREVIVFKKRERVNNRTPAGQKMHFYSTSLVDDKK